MVHGYVDQSVLPLAMKCSAIKVLSFAENIFIYVYNINVILLIKSSCFSLFGPVVWIAKRTSLSCWALPRDPILYVSRDPLDGTYRYV